MGSQKLTNVLLMLVLACLVYVCMTVRQPLRVEGVRGGLPSASHLLLGCTPVKVEVVN